MLATLGILLAILGVPGWAAGDEAQATLSGSQEVPAISTVASGRFEGDINATSMAYTLSYSGIEGGSVLDAHIHVGQPDVNGGIVVYLCGGAGKPPCPPAPGTVTGVILPTDVRGAQGIPAGAFAEFVAAMRAGVTYVNVHSTPGFRDGEIRGSIRVRDNDD
jgi:hypothetical protein